MKQDTKVALKLVVFSVISIGLVVFILAWPYLLHARNGGNITSFIALIVANWWLYALAIVAAASIGYFRLRK